MLLKILKDRFGSEKWEVQTVEDGEAAVEKINKEKFDLVLLDLILPKKDGLEVLKEVRENSELRKMPIVVLSNLGADEDIKKALNLGANDYFVKTQHPIGEILEKAETFISRDIEKLE